MNATTLNCDNFPKRSLIAIGVMLLVTLVSVAAVSITRQNAGTEATAFGNAVIARTLHFEDRSDGGIAVLDAATGAEVAQVSPGTNGFLRSTLRGLARERKLRGLGAAPPFVLALRSDGRLTIDDPATGRHVDLNAFGATNAAVFRHFLPAIPAAAGTQLAASGLASPGVTLVNR